MTNTFHSRVKIFFDSSHLSLCDQLLQWPDGNTRQIYVLGINMDSNQYGHNLAVLYTETPGPRYRAGVWFHSRHSDLEQDVNAAVAETPASVGALVAVGSNEYGHCLCLIEALAD